MIKKLVIVGVGLIGGSLARALRQARYVGEIIGVGKNADNLQKAIELGVIDHAEISISNAARNADAVIVAVPVGSMSEIFAQLAPVLSEDCVVTDVGSVKSSVVVAARARLGHHFANYVPGHPIAGAEKSGVEASSAELFCKRRVILTPLPETHIAAVEVVRALWCQAGAEVMTMAPDQHDEVFAATSHLPHLLAYTLVDMLAQIDDGRNLFDFAASGFRDFTRIASSDPVMWRDICIANRDAIIAVLNHYKSNVDSLLSAIADADGSKLLKTFTRAKQMRDGYLRDR